jgi:glycogen(starch) synthase
MRVLMLGWEFPPFIAGGLGTACYGLTRALDRLGHEVLFILPRPVDRSAASHVTLMTPVAAVTDADRSLASQRGPGGTAAGGQGAGGEAGGAYQMKGFEHTRFMDVPAAISSPYPGAIPAGLEAGAGGAGATDAGDRDRAAEVEAFRAAGVWVPDDYVRSGAGGPGAAAYAQQVAGRSDAAYGGDVIGDAERYARLVVAMARRETFDVIHAHDWLTYPAGLALARVTGKPLVAHVHSTEFDRSGDHVNQRVYDIERRGMHGAARVIAVSNLTKSICERRYAVMPGKIDVVYNGIEDEAEQPGPEDQIGARDKIVLFLGRITMQKGPEYFITAAKRVLEKVENVKFVVAGSGDMAKGMIEQAAAIGIGHKVLFTGFLRGRDVERVFQMADCYVMPSVSEPFGIAALEAVANDVPVIISKQSGVAEVLTHALKVDFWDTDEMANKIIAVLRHPPLSQTLRHHGAFELRRLTWEGAAEKCVRTYGRALGMAAVA